MTLWLLYVNLGIALCIVHVGNLTHIYINSNSSCFLLKRESPCPSLPNSLFVSIKEKLQEAQYTNNLIECSSSALLHRHKVPQHVLRPFPLFIAYVFATFLYTFIRILIKRAVPIHLRVPTLVSLKNKPNIAFECQETNLSVCRKKQTNLISCDFIGCKNCNSG